VPIGSCQPFLSFFLPYPRIVELGFMPNPLSDQEMKFSEKLLKLLHGTKATAVAQAAGVGRTAISKYLHNDSMPSADAALRLARHFRVPLEWLVDDAQDWPAPASENRYVSDVSDEELMTEVGRRYRLQILSLHSHLDEWSELNWIAEARALYSITADQPVPPDLAQLMSNVGFCCMAAEEMRFHFDPVIAANRIHANSDYEGSDNLEIDAIILRLQQLEKTPGFPEVRAGFYLRRDLQKPETKLEADRRRREVLARLGPEIPDATMISRRRPQRESSQKRSG